MVPLNSWPMVMGRDSLVTGWGVTGEKLCVVSKGLLGLYGLGRLRGYGVLGAGEVFVEVWRGFVSIFWWCCWKGLNITYLFRRCRQKQAALSLVPPSIAPAARERRARS